MHIQYNFAHKAFILKVYAAYIIHNDVCFPQAVWDRSLSIPSRAGKSTPVQTAINR